AVSGEETRRHDQSLRERSTRVAGRPRAHVGRPIVRSCSDGRQMFTAIDFAATPLAFFAGGPDNGAAPPNRTHVTTRLLTTLAIITGFASAAAQQPARVDANQIDSIIRRNIADKHIIGVSVGIMQNGQVVFARGYGSADLSSRAPVTPRT